ncbi:hypothetical protein B7453_19390 [Pseudomonas sp. IB20]|uniref:hypothetical protein n=1 Tax=Pseudomonas TaxID=286 RepID=UPI000BA10EFA|nr:MULTISPECIES: hypothetical protein [unclassified Pseudomonas]MCV2230293.1 hypothetical protein [Pseudomonas sp. AU10]OZO02859.1 hypothetical protein B7453_19390 [Pseudomonas sp. IB20]
MKAEHPSSSEHKAITPPAQGRSSFKPPRPLLATAVIGAALIGYLVHKTPDARQRLESMAEMAQALGDLSESDAAVVADLLAKPTIKGSVPCLS